jgi:hypothetical protein
LSGSWTNASFADAASPRTLEFFLLGDKGFEPLTSTV